MYKVIDVSDWQDKIDWKKVKADGVVGAIIRYADGTTLDKRFAENMKNAKAAGIHIGSYIFSRASTKTQAENEAKRLYDACKPYAPDMPLYIDLEASGLSKYADTVASAFLNKMKALGGKGGVYANLNWWNNYLKKTAKNYSESPFWIAQYNSTMDYKPSSVMGMWQYSSKGKVSGIKGNVDMDRCYVEYWKKSTTTAPKPTPAPAKKTIDELANEVLKGKWGAGNTRKKKLIAAGYDYYAVQKRVNEILNPQPDNIGSAISKAAKTQVTWEQKTIYKWEKQPTITKSKTYGTCVTYVACVLQRIGVLEPGQFVWTDGTGFGDGKVIGANNRMAVTYYKNNKTVKDIKSTLKIGDILIFNDNKSGKAGNCGHICIYNGNTYSNGINTFTGGHTISANGKEKYTRKVFAVVRVNSIPTRKTVDELAHEVLDGKWGSGDKRKENLINRGYDYDAVQKRVNEIIAGQKKAYSGEFPTTKFVKSTTEVIADAIKFANWIVGDNRFGYGRKGGAKYKGTAEYKVTHRGGCHFCGSNAEKISKAKAAGLKNPEEWEYTYVCSTFVHACYAHAGVPSMLKATGHAWEISSYQKSSYWTQIEKPSKLTDLKPGDILASKEHYCMYIGNGKGAEATSGGGDPASSTSAWNNSIRICDFTKHFKGATHIFRLTKAVNTTANIKYGEVSKRVGLLQKFLIWYGISLTADNLFGDATLAAVKKFQKATGLTVDGIVGDATIAAMRAYKK